MSGIFKGDSIYKSGGGGGGGYKDGGELVDGDFIKIENNAISYYDNVSRDPINFYFDVADGEILNSVVELTTAVNATINVYVVKNGFYYLLGNVGGNTVNAGEDYNLNIVGNSFMLEVVTPGPAEPEAAIIDGQIYGLKKVGSVLWTTSNVSLDIYSPHIYNDDYYYDYFNDYDGWRLPNENDVTELFNNFTAYQLKSTTGWIGGGGNGDNSSGLNFYPKGYWNIYTSDPTNDGYTSENLFRRNDNSINRFTISNNLVWSGYDPAPVRLVKNI